jgi:hypothetical protein
VLSVLVHCVWKRHGTPRPLLPEPGALIGHPLWLWKTRRPVAAGCGCCPSPEPGTSLASRRRLANLLNRTGRGHRILSRSQSIPPWLSALVTQVAREPQDVCGAATGVGWHLRTEIQSPFSRLLSRDKQLLFTPVFIFVGVLFLGRHTGPIDSFRSPMRLHVVSVLHRTRHPSGARHRDRLHQEQALPAPGSPSPSTSSGPYRVHVADRRRG